MTYGDSFRVVIGIDFGTSRSGYAYAFADDKRIVGRIDWPGQAAPYIKTLTQLLYSPQMKVEAWGYEARLRLAQLRQNRDAASYHFFQDFKMKLREAELRSEAGPILKHGGTRFQLVDLVSDYLKKLKEMALADVKEATSGHLRESEIRWCLTVPAIWSDADKQLMRQAAQMAGLIGSGEEEAERLLLVLEPEAAAIHCQERDKTQLVPGTRFMIVDCGGGTVDITVHETLPSGGLKEVAAGTGGAHGSTYVDRTFLDYLKKRLSPEVLQVFHDEEPLDYVEMMADWERTKCTFDPGTSGSTIFFPIRPKLYKLMVRHFPDVLSQLAADQDEEDEFVHLSMTTMREIFEPTIHALANKVEEQFDRLGKQRCDLLFLVGGFATSPFLRQHIQKRFGSRVKKIVVPPVPGAAIVEGAVSFGLAPSLIRSRRTRLTYGCGMSRPFRDGSDRPANRFWAADHNAWYCNHLFCVFVEAGSAVAVDEVVTHTFGALEHKQTEAKFDFYATRSKAPKYLDEPGVEHIGMLTVLMPDTTGGTSRQIKISFHFGRTEIQAMGVDVVTGKQYKTMLRFSSTYSPLAD